MIDRTAHRTRTAPTRPHGPADAAPADGVLLVDVHAVGRLLSCSARHVEDLHREALMPAARRLGRLLRWDVAELREWVTAGCPDRQTWEAQKAGDSVKVARPNGDVQDNGHSTA
jgi:hypothetical protein